MRRAILALIAILSVALPAGAQEIIVPEGDTLLVKIATGTDTVQVIVTDTLVIELPADTVFVPVPPDTVIVQLPPDTVFVVDTVYVEVPPTEPPDSIPPPEVDSIPPLPVSGLTLTLTGAEVLVRWNDRPDPDRGGVGTDGYYVASGNDTTGEPNPTDDVAGTPHRITLTAPGKHYVCVTPYNAAGTPSSSSCGSVTYELPPEPVGPYLLSVAPEPYSMSGNLDVVEGSYSVHLDRIDGTWNGLGDVTLPSVDSVVFCSGGVCNREGRLPYELGGGAIPLTTGAYEITWEVFGTEPGSGSSTVTVTSAEDGNPIEIGAAPVDGNDYAMGVGCDWGDQRCTDAGELVDIAMTAGTTGRLIGLIEFPPDERIFVSFQGEIVQVTQNDRGWVCVLQGGDRYAFPTIEWEWDSTDDSIASVDNGPMLTLPVNCP